MSDTIELKITTITEEENTWPPCHVGFILEWDGGSHCCRGEDEYIYFYTSDSYKKIIDCIGLRWSPMPEFSVSKEDKKDSSSKSAVAQSLMIFARELNLAHQVGAFEMRVPNRLFDKVDYELYDATRYSDSRFLEDPDSIRLYYDGRENVLTLTKLDEGKRAKLKWEGLHTLGYYKNVLLRNNVVFFMGPMFFCGARNRMTNIDNYYSLSICNFEGDGLKIKDIMVPKDSKWEWCEVPE